MGGKPLEDSQGVQNIPSTRDHEFLTQVILVEFLSQAWLTAGLLREQQGSSSQKASQTDHELFCSTTR